MSCQINFCCSGLPYDVTNEEALKHEEVQKLMEESIQQLRLWSDKFLSLILSSLDQIPYGMRCIAKVMYDSLTEKFPSSGEKDILKVCIGLCVWSVCVVWCVWSVCVVWSGVYSLGSLVESVQSFGREVYFFSRVCY